MKLSNHPLILRPREKLLAIGAENITNEELLAIVLSSGIKGKNVLELAREIINYFGDNILNVSIRELCQIKGLGIVKATQLKAAFEISLRYANLLSGKVIINNSKDAYLILNEYSFKKQEHFLLLTLNGRNQLISKKVITVGTLDMSLFHPREIFAESILDRAAKIIVAHNHPSGNLIPSKQDLIMTERIRESGEILGIELIDSIIISEDGYRSILHDHEAVNTNNNHNVQNK